MKNRPIPYFSMEGTVFEVDIENQRLIERANPANTISFVWDMTDKDSYYTFTYDLDKKNVYDKSTGFYESEDWTQVRVPKLIELDPEGMAEKYGFTVTELQGKNDFEVIVNQRLLTERQNGVLPQIRIMDERFHIVLREHELWPAGHWGPNISLADLTISDDGSCYEGYYHPALKKVVKIDPKLIEFPEGIVKIKIPNEIGLDPVGAARIYGMDERGLLRRYPIQKELKANIIPLAETNIPAMIQRNREALQQEHRENLLRAKPRIRPRF